MSNDLWRQRRFWIWLLAGTLVVGLIALRLALPSIVKNYVNRTLDDNEDYDGHIEDVDIALLRGAYSIHGIEIVKTSGEVPEPLFAAETVDLSILWSALLRGTLVGEIDIYRPQLNFVNAQAASGDQTGKEEDWRKTVRELFPTRIDRLAIHDGEIHYVDRTGEKPIDVMLNNVQAEALNLTNSEDIAESLAATIRATSDLEGTGHVELQAKLDPYADLPTFDSNLRVTGVDLTRFNDLIEKYVKFDLEAGRMDLNIELAALEGRMEGYVKPILSGVRVVRKGEFEKDDEGPLRAAWEVAAGAVKGVLNNEQADQLATRIPIAGRLDQPDVAPWPAIGSALRNAFIEALRNSLENSVTLSDVNDDVSSARDAREERKEKRKDRKEKKRGRRR